MFWAGERLAIGVPAKWLYQLQRVDLLLVEPDCRARHEIEYQGTSHNRRSAAARDAAKKKKRCVRRELGITRCSLGRPRLRS